MRYRDWLADGGEARRDEAMQNEAALKDAICDLYLRAFPANGYTKKDAAVFAERAVLLTRTVLNDNSDPKTLLQALSQEEADKLLEAISAAALSADPLHAFAPGPASGARQTAELLRRVDLTPLFTDVSAPGIRRGLPRAQYEAAAALGAAALYAELATEYAGTIGEGLSFDLCCIRCAAQVKLSIQQAYETRAALKTAALSAAILCGVSLLAFAVPRIVSALRALLFSGSVASGILTGTLPEDAALPLELPEDVPEAETAKDAPAPYTRAEETAHEDLFE